MSRYTQMTEKQLQAIIEKNISERRKWDAAPRIVDEPRQKYKSVKRNRNDARDQVYRDQGVTYSTGKAMVLEENDQSNVVTMATKKSKIGLPTTDKGSERYKSPLMDDFEASSIIMSMFSNMSRM